MLTMPKVSPTACPTSAPTFISRRRSAGSRMTRLPRRRSWSISTWSLRSRIWASRRGDHASLSITNSATNHHGFIGNASGPLAVSPVLATARHFGPPPLECRIRPSLYRPKVTLRGPHTTVASSGLLFDAFRPPGEGHFKPFARSWANTKTGPRYRLLDGAVIHPVWLHLGPPHPRSYPRTGGFF